MKGEFYPSITEVITEEEAWDMIEEYYHADIEQEIEDCITLHNFDRESATDYIRSEWRKQGISNYEGVYQRADGFVEVSA